MIICLHSSKHWINSDLGSPHSTVLYTTCVYYLKRPAIKVQADAQAQGLHSHHEQTLWQPVVWTPLQKFHWKIRFASLLLLHPPSLGVLTQACHTFAWMIARLSVMTLRMVPETLNMSCCSTLTVKRWWNHDLEFWTSRCASPSSLGGEGGTARRLLTKKGYSFNINLKKKL